MSKKAAFTMVELIFVIVILGILAAVAVPRLNASRLDAKIAKASADISTLMKDIESYYQANGALPATIDGFKDITNVALVKESSAGSRYAISIGEALTYYVDDVPCFMLSLSEQAACQYAPYVAGSSVQVILNHFSIKWAPKDGRCDKIAENLPSLVGYLYVKNPTEIGHIRKSGTSSGFQGICKIFSSEVNFD